MQWDPHITVATVVERDSKFLLVEELADDKVVVNQPAGHWDQGETLFDAAVRETLEETGYKIKLRHFIGIYIYNAPNGITYQRLCFAGEIIEHKMDYPLDQGIIRPLWLSPDELTNHSLRSPLVVKCIQDYLEKRYYPLELIYHHSE